MTKQAKNRASLFVLVLSILLSLFCLRVLAQLLQWYFDLPLLPEFNAWQSGALPYQYLLPSQIFIIAVYGWILWRIATLRASPRRRQGWVFLSIGLVYFLAMALRLAIGVGGLSEHYWFHSYLPIFFHFVLSAYLLIVGLFHLQAKPPE